ncbi:uncharacterized protein BX663DRAFT_562340 [Cokeromyces recurvatus]|uniref:uncharacterized protein n=1 Tax=Cokeromyces recurvatus TaxID=90255 RepID=UPI0022200636|nr:uncharacterized protein BX663DRAFT_562340 [Cokeromyces recurvatus]KAI7901437.1 hypothetical protein BX663DRAFT_562340 [Cokeromyces recurvatus]
MENIDIEKKESQLSSQAQWCLDNKKDLSLKKFVEHYKLTSRHYASSKYINIINRYLIDDQKRLLSEYNIWKHSENSARFWTGVKRRKAQAKAHAGAVEYVDNIINKKINQLCKDSSSYNKNQYYTELQANKIFNYHEYLSRFETEQDRNMYELFDIYEAEATEVSSNVGLMKIETHLHEILSLTNIMLLAPNQHSELLIEVFSVDTLNLLHQSLLNHIKDNKRETSTTNDKFDEIIIKMSRVIQAVDDNEMTRSDAELDLLNFARSQNYYLSRMIKGVNNALEKLPSNVIKNAASISENELFNTYFDPILSSIISDPGKNTILNAKDKERENRKDKSMKTLYSLLEEKIIQKLFPEK